MWNIQLPPPSPLLTRNSFYTSYVWDRTTWALSQLENLKSCFRLIFRTLSTPKNKINKYTIHLHGSSTFPSEKEHWQGFMVTCPISCNLAAMSANKASNWMFAYSHYLFVANVDALMCWRTNRNANIPCFSFMKALFKLCLKVPFIQLISPSHGQASQSTLKVIRTRNSRST